jgi:hypothetical protein
MTDGRTSRMFRHLFHRKPLHVLHEEMRSDNRLRRVLGPWSLTSLGVGCFWLWLASAALAQVQTAAESTLPAAPNLLTNGDFETGPANWQVFWTRDAGAGRAVLDRTDRHGGAQSIRIEHTGAKDWSFAHSLQLAVQAGEIYDLSAWVRLQGGGSASLGVVTRDAAGNTLDWDHAGQTVRETKDWRPLHARFIVPPGVATIQPRLTGNGPAVVWLDDVALTRQGSLDALRRQDLPPTQTIRNPAIEIAFRTADATIEARDLRANRSWAQTVGSASVVVLDARTSGGVIVLRLLDPLSMREIAATIRLDADRPECIVTLRAEGAMEAPLAWPAPFASAAGQTLILPVNEGIGYPAADATLPEMSYYLYGGHGLCMPWYGATDGTAGWQALVETPDDAAVRISRREGLLSLAPEWQAQKGLFGPVRVIRYVFFDRGGYVAMAKRYRDYAKQTGLFKTLEEKRKTLPAVDLLVGAVNVWCWDNDAPSICREMQSAGIRRILWSNQRPPEELEALNALGVLTSRYDIYQDAMNPEEFPRLSWQHPDWTSDAWKNNDLMMGADGQWVRGWEVETKDGGRIPCGTLCDRQALSYAQRRIPADLATHPYRCRFIDTTTASPWRECYDPNHPMTRTDSKRYKMDLLRYVSEGCGLVCGSETGHDAAVPYVHYFEGMLSLGPYRVPDAGRNMQQTVDDVPEAVAKFQTGHVYRLPLWDLVYHDCVVAQWYWGDYNNKLPKLWDRRDLWNALYGTPPMFMCSRKSWEANRDRFVRSYRTAEPMARATGYSEMLSHEWLTPDHAVQRTRFANGVAVTVNFGDAPFALPDGTSLAQLGYRVEGVTAAAAD